MGAWSCAVNDDEGCAQRYRSGPALSIIWQAHFVGDGSLLITSKDITIRDLAAETDARLHDKCGSFSSLARSLNSRPNSRT